MLFSFLSLKGWDGLMVWRAFFGIEGGGGMDGDIPI